MMSNLIVENIFKNVTYGGSNTKEIGKAIREYLKFSRKFRKKQLTRREISYVNKPKNVEEEITHEFIEKVRKMFQEADLDGGGGLDMNEFIIAMRKIYPNHSEKELKVLYMKVDTNCDNSIDIIEYLVYILFEHQEKEHMFEMTRPKPYPKLPREITLKSLTWDLLISVDFYPILNRNGVIIDEVDYLYGRYFCLTKHGILLQLDIDLNIIKQTNLNESSTISKTSSVWASIMLCIPDMNLIAISDIENNLSLFDLNTPKLERTVLIRKLPGIITSMDYRFSPTQSGDSMLFCGDNMGNIVIFYPKEKTRPMFHLKGIRYNTSKNHRNVRVYEFSKILDKNFEILGAIFLEKHHLGSIIGIKWIANLNSFISCSTTNTKSLFFGDVDGRIKQYYSCKNGFACFDYYKKLNMIITGGQDCLIRIWEPFVASKASNILRGHNYSITHLVVDEPDDTLISIDKSQNVFIWYLMTSKIVQKILLPHNSNIEKGPDISCIYFNKTRQKLLIFNNKITAFEHTNEIFLNRDRSSHTKPVLCIVYNNLFEVLASADENSVINIWDIKTGTKVMHILDAHSSQEKYFDCELGSEITALAFDESLRKLISGANDGTVAIWNFNNGMLIEKFIADNESTSEQREITCIIHKNERLCLSSWNKTVIVYYLGTNGLQFLIRFPVFHDGIILSMDIYQNKLATASYDGCIIFWSTEIGIPVTQFKLKESLNFQFVDRSREIKSKIKRDSRKQSHIVPTYRKFTRRMQSMDSFSYTNNLLENNNYYMDKIYFTKTRLIHNKTANLFTAGALGWVRVWAADVNPRLLGQFNAAHNTNHSVSTFCFDKDEMLLFTADTYGYVKIWFIGDYFNNIESEKDRMVVSEAKLFYKTLFETSDTVAIKSIKERLENERRDRLNELVMANNENLKNELKNLISYPLLLRYFRAHVKSITGIEYINDKKMIITSSIDFNVRIFTLTGRYIGFFGQNQNLNKTSIQTDNNYSNDKDIKPSIPRDIRRVASANTFKVVYGATGNKWKLLQKTIRSIFGMRKCSNYQEFYSTNRPQPN